MINKFVTSISGIDLYGMVSICLFVGVFVGSIVWACTRQKNFINQISHLPLEDGESQSKPK